MLPSPAESAPAKRRKVAAAKTLEAEGYVLQLDQELGSGSFGKVVKGFAKEKPDRIRAIKMAPVRPGRATAAAREAIVLQKLTPSFARCMGSGPGRQLRPAHQSGFQIPKIDGMFHAFSHKRLVLQQNTLKNKLSCAFQIVRPSYHVPKVNGFRLTEEASWGHLDGRPRSKVV